MEITTKSIENVESILIMLRFKKTDAKKNKGHNTTKVYKNSTYNITVRLNKRSISIHAMTPYKYIRTNHQQGLNALRNYIQEN